MTQVETIATMRAATCTAGELAVAELPVPEPGPGQVLLRVLRTGICGSDLHARQHADQLADVADALGYRTLMRPDDRVVMGHELLGEVVSYGPSTRGRWKPGTRIVALPMVRHGEDIHMVGFDRRSPGGFAEYVVVQEAFAFPVPRRVPDDKAAFTEPLAVAWHAVRRGEVGRHQPAIVIGCGPIGLAVILVLKAKGVRTVIASDLSPVRRALALRCGADVAVDPRVQQPWSAYRLRGPVGSLTDYARFGMDAVGLMRRVPLLPWGRMIRAGERLGIAPTGPVVFECVGVPGVLDEVYAKTPLRSRVVAVGVCMEPDTVRTAYALNKELEVRYVFGYDPEEFGHALDLIASGKIDPTPLHTGTVGLADLGRAFDDLAGAEEHAKILVDPSA